MNLCIPLLIPIQTYDFLKVQDELYFQISRILTISGEYLIFGKYH